MADSVERPSVVDRYKSLAQGNMKAAFWQVQPKHLNALDAESAVAILRELLCAEAGRLGIPLTSIDVPSALTTRDGGIDGEVRAAPKNDGDLLFEGTTRYQVKTGTFSLAKSDKGLKEVLLRPNPRKKKGQASYAVDDIQPRVRDCLDQDGTLVVASFGDDLVQADSKSVETKIRDFLAKIDPRYANTKIKVWGRNQLCSLINRVIGLSLRVRGNDDMLVETFDQWQRHQSLQNSLQLGGPQQALIDTIRAQLRVSDYRAPIRILGEAGIGKTRLILEALRDDTLAPFVLYTDRPSSLIGSLPRLTSQASEIEAIVVVDECSPQERYLIVDQLASHAPHIRVITIYQEEVEGESDAVLAVEPLPQDQIAQILRSYGAPEADLSVWTDLCEGSPRLAHLIGENLRSDPANPIKNRNQLLDRTIAGATTIGSLEFNQRKLVLSSLALFKRFGFEQPFDSEFADIYKCVISPLDHTLSYNACKTIIRDARKRRILQGEKTLYITPRLLHVWLWTEWWSLHGSSNALSEMLACIPPRLQEWLGEMMQYARESEGFLLVARSLFQSGGPLNDLENLKTTAKRRFFFNVSLAVPDQTLDWLEASFARLSSRQLRQIEVPRREIVPALQRIAMDADHFERAAKLLARLAVTENEEWSNNATGVFADLFSLGHGRMAASASPPEDRLQILLDLLRSEQSEERKLALHAFDKALSTNFVRVANLDRHGLRRQENLWTPKTYGEIHAAYGAYWRGLRGQLGTLMGKDRVEAARVLLGHTRSLCRIPTLADEVIATLEQLRTERIVDDREVIRVVEDILRYDGDKLPSELKAKFVDMRERLVVGDFSSLMRRYVGMKLIADHFDQEGKHIEGPHPQVIRLAEAAIEDRAALRRELPWLVTPDAANGYDFGRALADRDEGVPAFWPDIRDTWLALGKDASDFFIGGYLSGVYRRDPGLWEKAVFELLESTAPRTIVTSVIWRSGMTERVGRAILDVVRSGEIPPETLQTFSFGRVCDDLPADVFEEWIRFLVNVGSRAAVKAALTLSSFRAYNRAIELPDELVRKLLFHEIFFEGERGARWESTDEFHWVDFAERWSRGNEQKLEEAGAAILRALSISGSIIDDLTDQSRRLLDKAIATAPEALWRVVANLIDPSKEGTHYGLSEWLRGGDHFGDQNEGILDSFPRSSVLQWIAGDPEARAIHVAYFVPKDVAPQKWRDSLWRDLLVLYGDQRSLRTALEANYYSEGWVGPGSLHQAKKTKELEEILADETNPDARAWLKEMLRQRRQMLERETIEEEREE